jgi:adenylate cyclase
MKGQSFFTKHQHSPWLPTAVGAAVGLLCALCWNLGVFHTLSLRASDQLFAVRKTNAHIVLVAIDDVSLTTLGRWPWDRSVHASLISAVAHAGARVIAYDVNMSEPQDPKEDTTMAEAIAQAGNVVLPIELGMETHAQGYAFSPDRVLRPTPVIGAGAAGTGFSNMLPDPDGVVRRLPLFAKNNLDGTPAVAFSVEAARIADPSIEHLQPPLDAHGELIIGFAGKPFSTFPIVSAADVLNGKVPQSFFQNAIVFVGSTASDLHDEQLVPTSAGVPMPGVEIHASIADTLLEHAWLREASPLFTALLILALSALVGFAVGRWRNRWSMLFSLGMWVLLLITAVLAFDGGVVLDILWPSIAIFFAYAAVTAERRIASEIERRGVQRLFSRYLSPSVVDVILKHPSNVGTIGERRTMSVLFSDIRGFTSLTEGMRPETLLPMLNAYFSRMTDIVFEYEGVLDKFIGDAVMAFWNAPFDQVDHAQRAVSAALQMRDALKEMNASGIFGKEIGDQRSETRALHSSRSPISDPRSSTWKAGIGVNTGEMIVGNIGGGAHTDYTVIGDAVNIASRIEELTKEYSVDILLAEDTVQAVRSSILLRRIARVRVVGKNIPVNIYEAVERLDKTGDAKRRLCEQYERILTLYESSDFHAALEGIVPLRAEYPQDGPSKVLYDRIRGFLDNPPPKDWDGTWIYLKK